MNSILKGFCWAAAMLLVVTAKKYGVFDAEAADTLMLVLPIVAVLSLRSRRECSLLRQNEA